MNIAVELDSKIYNKMQKETVFTPIKNEVRKPNKENENIRKSKLRLKERKALNHLG